MMNKIFALAAFLFTGTFAFAQNVGINTTGATPDNSAMLDIDAGNRGLLIPRVALSATNNASPVTSPATSLMVYNTATAGSGATAVTPGYYYWGGSAWIRVATDGDSWKTIGNSTTVAPSSGIGTAVNNNYIGTNDAIDFAIATNGFERFRIKSDNNTQIRIGVGTAFTVNLNSGSTPSLFHLHDWGSSANDFAQLNLSSSTTTNGNRVGVINFAATTVTNERRTASIESHITNYTAPDAIGDLRFFTNNSSSYTEKMRIQGDGNIGINTTQPIYKTDIRSSTNKGTTAALEYLFHIGSANTTDPLGIRIGIRTLNSPITNRFAAIEVDDAGNKRPLSLQPNGGNVGIGATLPSFKLEILDTISDKHLGLHRNSTTNGDAAGIYFRVHTTGTDNYKGAILFERTATNGRGSLHFVTSDISSTANVGLPDSKMIITREGNVGIGTTTPGRLFEVSINQDLGHIQAMASVIRMRNANNATCATDKAWDFRIGNCGQLGLTTYSGNGNPNFNILRGDAANNNSTASSGPVIAFNTLAPLNSIVLDQNGNLGLNNPLPNAKLDVAGSIKTSLSGSIVMAGLPNGIQTVNLTIPAVPADLVGVANAVVLVHVSDGTPGNVRMARLTSTTNIEIDFVSAGGGNSRFNYIIFKL